MLRKIRVGGKITRRIYQFYIYTVDCKTFAIRSQVRLRILKSFYGAMLLGGRIGKPKDGRDYGSKKSCVILI